jgi:hypothetical protein
MTSGKLIMTNLSSCPTHPTRKVHARGVCRSCYDKQLKAENPAYAERQRANSRTWVEEHKAQNDASKRAWEQKRGPAYNHAKKLKAYGLTPADYENMLATQNGGCNICRKAPATGRRLHVDHCHKTGRVRGLLCFRCNFGLSFFGDDVATVERALAHLS